MAPPRKILKSLPLVGFGQTPMELDRRADWENFALKIINHFRSGVSLWSRKPGLAKPSSPRWRLSPKWRTLFLAPQRLWPANTKIARSDFRRKCAQPNVHRPDQNETGTIGRPDYFCHAPYRPQRLPAAINRPVSI